MLKFLYNNDGQLTPEVVEYQSSPCAVAETVSPKQIVNEDYTVVNSFSCEYKLNRVYKLDEIYFRLLYWIEGADYPNRVEPPNEDTLAE